MVLGVKLVHCDMPIKASGLGQINGDTQSLIPDIMIMHCNELKAR